MVVVVVVTVLVAAAVAAVMVVTAAAVVVAVDACDVIRHDLSRLDVHPNPLEFPETSDLASASRNL